MTLHNDSLHSIFKLSVTQNYIPCVVMPVEDFDEFRTPLFPNCLVKLKQANN